MPAVPETVAAYIAECAGRLKVGSIQRRLNAIAEAHKATGLDSPTTAGMVRNTLKGIRRTIGTAAKPKAAALTDQIRTMVDAAGDDTIGARDSRTNPVRVCRGVPPVRTSRSGYRGLRLRQGRPDGHSTA